MKSYKDDLQQALRDLLTMASEKEQLETKIAKQKKRVAALYELVATEGDSVAISGLVEGITDACRSVFRAAEKPLLPSEVRDRVQALGVPPQANLLASVHTTIKRLKDAEEIEDVKMPLENGGMGTAYQWNERMVPLSSLSGSPDLESARDAFRRAHDAKLARESFVGPGSAERSGMLGSGKPKK